MRHTGFAIAYTIWLISLTHPAATLPSIQQNWAAHKRALLQLQSELASNQSAITPPPISTANDDSSPGNASTSSMRLDTPSEEHPHEEKTDQHPDKHQYHTPQHPNPPTPALDSMPIAHTAATSTPIPTFDDRAESMLKLLLENVDHSDAKTMAQKFLPYYANQCRTAFDCEEFGATIRRLYLTKYNELEQLIHKMDKTGPVLRRIQHMMKKHLHSDESSESKQRKEHHLHRHHHSGRRRPGRQHPNHRLRDNMEDQIMNR